MSTQAGKQINKLARRITKLEDATSIVGEELVEELLGTAALQKGAYDDDDGMILKAHRAGVRARAASTQFNELVQQLLVIKRQQPARFEGALSIIGGKLADGLVAKGPGRRRENQTAAVIEILRLLVGQLETADVAANMAALGSSGTNPARVISMKVPGQDIQAAVNALVARQRPTGAAYDIATRLR